MITRRQIKVINDLLLYDFSQRSVNCSKSLTLKEVDKPSENSFKRKPWRSRDMIKCTSLWTPSNGPPVLLAARVITNYKVMIVPSQASIFTVQLQPVSAQSIYLKKSIVISC